MQSLPNTTKKLARKQAEALRSLRQKGRHRETLKRCARLIKDHPGDPIVLNAMAFAYAALGDETRAVAIFQRLARDHPGQAAAHHNLGLTLRRTGAFDEATESLRRAIALDPANLAYRADLGATFTEQKDWAAAAEVFLELTRLSPKTSQYHAHAGHALAKLDDTEGSIASYLSAIRLEPDDGSLREAIATVHKMRGELEPMMQHLQVAQKLDPDNANIYFMVGTHWFDRNDGERSRAALERAVKLDPGHWQSHALLGNVYRGMKDKDLAIAAYRRTLELQPGQPNAEHFLASLTGQVTDTAPSGYVRDLFDNYADRFEASLVKNLEYQTPDLLAKMLAAHRKGADPMGVMLDLGCGTGLAAEALKGQVLRNWGIDLSPGMIEVAREKELYERLEVNDLESSVADWGGDVDLFACADVLVYVGDLAPLFAALKAHAKPGALFLFSTEHEADSDRFVLRESGRYAHSQPYVLELAAAHEFDVLAAETGDLRRESGVMLAGGLYLLRL